MMARRTIDDSSAENLTESTADPQVKNVPAFHWPGYTWHRRIAVFSRSMIGRWNLPIEQSIIILLNDGTILSFLLYRNFCMQRLTTIVKHQLHLISPCEIHRHEVPGPSTDPVTMKTLNTVSMKIAILDLSTDPISPTQPYSVESGRFSNSLSAGCATDVTPLNCWAVGSGQH